MILTTLPVDWPIERRPVFPFSLARIAKLEAREQSSCKDCGRLE